MQDVASLPISTQPFNWPSEGRGSKRSDAPTCRALAAWNILVSSGSVAALPLNLPAPKRADIVLWANHHGCVAGRETLGVTLLTRHRLSRQPCPGDQPDYALTLPGGERDGDTCGFHTSDPNTTVLEVVGRCSPVLPSYSDDAIHFTSSTIAGDDRQRIQLPKSEHAYFSKRFA